MFSAKNACWLMLSCRLILTKDIHAWNDVHNIALKKIYVDNNKLY